MLGRNKRGFIIAQRRKTNKTMTQSTTTATHKASTPSPTPVEEATRKRCAPDQGDASYQGAPEGPGRPTRQRMETEDFICPITRGFMVEPVYAADGRVYEKEALLEHFQSCLDNHRGIRSPITNEYMNDAVIPANHFSSLFHQLVEQKAFEKADMCEWKTRAAKYKLRTKGRSPANLVAVAEAKLEQHRADTEFENPNDGVNGSAPTETQREAFDLYNEAFQSNSPQTEEKVKAAVGMGKLKLDTGDMVSAAFYFGFAMAKGSFDAKELLKQTHATVAHL